MFEFSIPLPLLRSYNQFGGIDESALDRLSLVRTLQLAPPPYRIRHCFTLQRIPFGGTCTQSPATLSSAHAASRRPLRKVTEMTKLIHVKAGGGGADDIGHFSPSFLWLLRDFYLELR